MLTDVFRQAKLNIYHSRWQDPPSERDAIITLAVVAWLSFLVYVLVLADPFGLLAYYRYQQLHSARCFLCGPPGPLGGHRYDPAGGPALLGWLAFRT